ncbi:patatin-like phospholipase family protein [Lysobacter sp. 5GHs7-4]|uniref:patatin-like phospholipase family protein n=1 Tax=Lysobacter sp. 5GHs7-4 TaxID=2904253 RepID=UPI001E46B1AD|nr:patatin-like phospholipase family protein [Lysobacter sp. 5GHs7-4]UHQ24417.1 patatin-like phospholipase family protein [Lysobacter sp. 5GHs7-4]
MSEPMSALADEAPLALCLSGGGLRATLFHLGVLQALRAARRGGRSALESVGEIYSVSGGSILAAHLVLNWEKYCGSEDEFQEMARQIRALAYRDIRNRVLRRWLSSCLLIVPRLMKRGPRTYWLRQEYESLYSKACLEELRGREGRPRPVLHLLSTSFRTGDMCSFSARHFEVSQVARGAREAKLIRTTAGRIPVAFAVAASSAFPPLFPPLRLTDRMLSNVDDPALQGITDLSDGGVYDNLGAEKLIYDRSRGASRASTVVLSNAGASFRTDQGAWLWGVVSRNVRASDIMMRRSADSTDHRIASVGMEVVDVRIGQSVDDAYLSEDTQGRLNKVRTDLDRFTPMLADMLVAHGFGTGLQALRKCQFETGDARPDAPQASAAKLEQVAEDAAKRGAFVLDLGDWATYALYAIFLVVFTPIFLVLQMSLLAEKVAAEKVTNEGAKDRKIEAQREEIKQLSQDKKDLIAELKKAGMLKDPVRPPAGALARGDYQVWIQFAGAIRRDEMKDFGRRIQSQWPNAPGALDGGERTPEADKRREVRYGNSEDLPAAIQLTADIDATGLFAPMNRPQPSTDIAPRSLEIWVSR